MPIVKDEVLSVLLLSKLLDFKGVVIPSLSLVVVDLIINFNYAGNINHKAVINSPCIHPLIEFAVNNTPCRVVNWDFILTDYVKILSESKCLGTLSNSCRRTVVVQGFTRSWHDSGCQEWWLRSWAFQVAYMF
jgi:hypothetical protein